MKTIRRTTRRSFQRILPLVTALFLLVRAGGAAGAETVRYAYDSMGRLLRATYETGALVKYGYDNIGNRQQEVTAATVSTCADRTVCNGDFEQDFTYWQSTANATLAGGRSGQGARVASDSANSDMYQLLPGVFEGGKTYRATAWCKAEAGAQCRIFFGDANGLMGPPYENTAQQSLGGNGDWQQLSVILTPTHDERLNIYVYSKMAGQTALYDDVQVDELPGVACGPRTVCNGDFEIGLAAWDSLENVTLAPGRSGQGVQVAQDSANSDIYQLLPGVFEGGQTYRATAWCKAEPGAQCRLFFGDANGLLGLPYENTAQQTLAGNGDWQQLSVILTPTHDERLNIYLYSKMAGQTARYDDVQVDELPGVACGPRTVCNGDFELGLAAWDSLENVTLAPGRSGQGVQVAQDGANNDIAQLLPGVFAGGQTYRATAWCKAEAGERCGLFFGDANTLANPPAYENTARQWVWGNGEWRQLGAILTLTHDERLNIYLYGPNTKAIYDDVRVDELPDGSCGPRTVCNGDFELGLAAWDSLENVTLAPGRSGQGVQVAQDSANSDIYQLLPGVFEGGQTYRATAWCLAEAGTQCRLFFGDANTSYGPAYENLVTQTLPGNGTWQQLAVTLRLSHDERLNLYVYSKTSGSTARYDDIRVEALALSGTATLTIAKAGDGQGVISTAAQECGLTCPELSLPYVKNTTVTIQVAPAADSYFVRWESAQGTPLAGIHYAQPGETVFAIFQKK